MQSIRPATPPATILPLDQALSALAKALEEQAFDRISQLVTSLVTAGEIEGEGAQRQVGLALEACLIKLTYDKADEPYDPSLRTRMHYYTPIPDLSVQLRCLIYLEGYLKKSNLTHKYFTPTMRSMLRLGTQTQAFSTANAVAHIFSYGWDSPEVPKSTRLYVGAKRVLFGLADARAPYYQDRIDKAFHEIQGARREGSGFWKKDLSPLANFFDYCIERARGFGQSLEDYEAYLMQAAQKWSLEHEQPALFKQVKAASPSQDSIATSLADKATTKVLYAMNYAEQIQLQQASPDLIGPLKSLHLDLKKESIATPPPKCRA